MISNNDYKCDCKGTGYIGERCSRGIIQLPSFPTLHVSKTSDLLFLEATPSQEIIIKPVVPNDVIVFHPNRLRITFPNKQVSFKIESKSVVAGRIRVEFELDGVDAPHFFTPRSTVIRVSVKNHVTLNRLVSEDLLLSQCFKRKVSKCSAADPDEISLYSSCSWNTGLTEGHVSVGKDDFRVPFSFSGYDVHDQNGGVISPRVSVSKIIGNRFPQCSSTCKSHLSQNEYDLATRNQYFIKAYLKQLSKLSPWWFQITVDPSYRGFDVNNLQSLIYEGELPRTIPTCANLPKIPGNGSYSLFAIKTPLNIQFMSSHFKTNGVGTSCVVLDLCRRVFYMSLPMKQAIDGTDALTKIGFDVQHLSMSGLSITPGGESAIDKCIDIYEGDSSLKRKCVGGNIWTRLSVVKRRKIFNMTFDGEVSMDSNNVQNVSKRVEISIVKIMIFS